MYQVYWDQESCVLRIMLGGSVTLEEFAEIDSVILTRLNQSPVNLVIDVTSVEYVRSPSIGFKASQTYTQHPMLKRLFIVGENKLLRLMMLLTFNLSRASLQFFTHIDGLESYLQIHKLKK